MVLYDGNGKEIEETIEINPEYMGYIIKGGPFNTRETMLLCVFFSIGFIFITLLKLGIISI